MGLRERKKEQTRRLIAETAERLFAARGFDRVTVAEVARQAEVAEATVFNYFPTKEALFYFGLEAFGAQLIEAISGRGTGESPLAAFRGFLIQSGGMLDEIEAGRPGALEKARSTARTIAASPALQAREHQVIARNADALAALLAAQTGAEPHDLMPQVAANALMGCHRALIDYARRRMLTAEEPSRIAAEVREQASRAFALLEHGLGDYAPGLAHATDPSG